MMVILSALLAAALAAVHLFAGMLRFLDVRPRSRWLAAAGGVSVAYVFVLAGGVMLNVLKEELPEECQSRFWAFAFGAGAYTVILLLAF